MPKKKIKTLMEFSAGGVVYRKTAKENIEVAIIKVGDRYALPKGLIEKGESTENAAVREVQEETGLKVAPIGRIDKIDYWYFWEEGGERTRRHKIVYFFLMKGTGGDTSKHDFEVNEVLWIPVEKAIEILSFKSEKAIVKKALEMLSQQNEQND